MQNEENNPTSGCSAMNGTTAMDREKHYLLFD